MWFWVRGAGYPGRVGILQGAPRGADGDPETVSMSGGQEQPAGGIPCCEGLPCPALPPTNRSQPVVSLSPCSTPPRAQSRCLCSPHFPIPSPAITAHLAFRDFRSRGSATQCTNSPGARLVHPMVYARASISGPGTRAHSMSCACGLGGWPRPLTGLMCCR